MEPGRLSTPRSRLSNDARAATALVGSAAWLIVRTALRRSPADATLAVIVAVAGLLLVRHARLGRVAVLRDEADALTLERGGRVERRIAYGTIRATEAMALRAGDIDALACLALHLSDARRVIVADLERVRFAAIRIEQDVVVHVQSLDALRDVLARRRPDLTIDCPGDASPSRSIAVDLAASSTGLATLVACVVRTRPDARSTLAMLATCAMLSIATVVARRRAALQRVLAWLVPLGALLATSAALMTRSVVVASMGLVWTVFALPVPPMPCAAFVGAAMTRTIRPYVIAIGLLFATIVAWRGMTILPILTLATLAHIAMSRELPTREPLAPRRWIAVVAWFVTALAVSGLLHTSDPALVATFRVLLE